jgi:hypothetical protein
MLQPCQPETLDDAQAWVKKWPEAVGHTNFMAALQLACNHCYADCWYIFSDGQADDALKCLEWLRARLAAGATIPPIHTIGGWGVWVHGRCHKRLGAGKTSADLTQHSDALLQCAVVILPEHMSEPGDLQDTRSRTALLLNSDAL